MYDSEDDLDERVCNEITISYNMHFSLYIKGYLGFSNMTKILTL